MVKNIKQLKHELKKLKANLREMIEGSADEDDIETVKSYIRDVNKKIYNQTHSKKVTFGGVFG